MRLTVKINGFVKLISESGKIVTKLISDEVSWGAFDGLKYLDAAMAYEVHMEAVTPYGNKMEYDRKGGKVSER